MNRPATRRGRRVWLPILAALLILLSAGCGSTSPYITYGPGASPAPSEQSYAGLVDDDDFIVGQDVALPAISSRSANIQLYPDRVSVLPGEGIGIHVSTAAGSYSLSVTREGATQPSYAAKGLGGHDYRSRQTHSNTTGLSRANYPIAKVVPTAGWAPGIYVISATDSLGKTGKGLVVVRSPTLSPSKITFVLPVMTYQAYNDWGGGSLYMTSFPMAKRVSFARPFSYWSGLSSYPQHDQALLKWLLSNKYAIDYTTDYDLSVAPPSVAPKLLLLATHMEYVPKPLYNWMVSHVETIGDMNLANFGANTIYWQSRIEKGSDGQLSELVCYRTISIDPLTKTQPTLISTVWRDPILNRPEGQLLGAQYVGIVTYARRFSVGFGSSIPSSWFNSLVSGTGWTKSTRILNLLTGEVDGRWAASGSTSLFAGTAIAKVSGNSLSAMSTLRVTAKGTRVFNASTFGWPELLSGTVSGGVSQASFSLFTKNLIAWMGIPIPGSYPLTNIKSLSLHLGFAAGTYTAYKFSSAGAVIASKKYTLARASGAPATKTARRAGKTYYYVSAGVWAGYWMPKDSRVTILP